MLVRVLEPEVMDTEHEALDYDAMDHSAVNQAFVADLLRELPSLSAGRSQRVFDAGTGTALIPIELLRAGFPAEIVAADAAREMLRVAREHVVRAGYAEQVTLVERDCKELPEDRESFDIVMSNSIVHHIPEPRAVLAECWRILRAGGLLFVRDLARPDSGERVEELVDLYAADANAAQRQLFRQSLHAALTVDEIGDLLNDLEIPRTNVAMTSDRHWTIAARKP